MGKSSIIKEFIEDKFDNANPSTISTECIYKCVEIPSMNTSVNFKIWDTSGQEQYHSMSSLYYRDAVSAIIVFDMTNKESFLNTKRWISEIKEKGPKNLLIILVGNKADLIKDHKVDLNMADSFAKKHDLKFKIVSAKENINITELFTDIANEIIINHLDDISDCSRTNSIKLSSVSEKTNTACC